MSEQLDPLRNREAFILGKVIDSGKSVNKSLLKDLQFALLFFILLPVMVNTNVCMLLSDKLINNDSLGEA